MDCVEGILGLDDESVDLTITSPPYDNLRLYNGKSDFSFKKFKEIAIQLYRITKQGGVVVWVVGDATVKGSETGTSFKQALYFKEVGFRLHDTMIYEKRNYIPLTHNRYEQCFEYMFVFSKGKPKTFNPIMIPCKTAGTINDHSSEKHYEATHSMRKREGKVIVNKYKIHPNKFIYTVGSGDKTEHNAPFPEQLVSDHILSWTNEGDIVFDPMCGSGTTLKMASLNKRKFIGFDINSKYCDISKRRVEKCRR